MRVCASLCVLLSLTTVAFAEEPPPVAGATVDESKVQKVYYVDAAAANAADDDAHGAAPETPFKTISRACAAAARDKDANLGVKIIVGDGVYREAVTFPVTRADADAPLIMEAANAGQAIIDGADTSGWEPNTWRHEAGCWTHACPPSPDALPSGPGLLPSPGAKSPAATAHLGNLIFVNGQALRQVLTPADLTPGCFCITLTAEPAAGRKFRSLAVRMMPPADLDAAGADSASIEFGVRAGGLTVAGRRNVVLRGLVVQHVSAFAALASGAFLLNGCVNVLVEDVVCQWNNSDGLRVSGAAAAKQDRGMTLRRVRLLYNGASGLFASGLKNLLVEDCETSFNGFRGDWTGKIEGGGAAGCKASSIHGGAWRRHHATGNWGRGMVWDGDAAGVTVEECVVRNNLLSGLLIANSPGPVSVRRCVVTGTKPHPSVRDDTAFPAGVSIAATPDVTLESNVIADNAAPQLGLWDVPQTAVLDFETHVKTPRRAERHVYRHNVLCGATADQALCNLPLAGAAGKGSFDFYYGSLASDENCFWNPARAEVFCTYDKTSYHRPGVDLAAWRDFLTARAGEGKTPEENSLWRDPLFTNPAEGDFRLRADSPVAGWNLLSDEGAAEQ